MSQQNSQETDLSSFIGAFVFLVFVVESFHHGFGQAHPTWDCYWCRLFDFLAWWGYLLVYIIGICTTVVAVQTVLAAQSESSNLNDKVDDALRRLRKNRKDS